MMKEKFNLARAKSLMKLGYFITCDGFDDNESIHMYNDCIFLEDGYVVDEEDTLIYIIEHQDEDIFYVKVHPDQIDVELLKSMHSDLKAGKVNFNDCLIFTYENTKDRKFVHFYDGIPLEKIITTFIGLKAIEGDTFIHYGFIDGKAEVSSIMSKDEIRRIYGKVRGESKNKDTK